MKVRKLERGFEYVFRFFLGLVIFGVVVAAIGFWSTYSVEAGNGMLNLVLITAILGLVRILLIEYRKHREKGDRR